jgi:HEAT repeat protein
MKFEERIEQLRQLRNVEPGPATDSKLRKALNDRSNLIVAEAAKIVGHHQRTSLIADLLSAYDRLFENPVKADPKCWGKTAIIKTLTTLDYSESPPFLRGCRHVQMEPVWDDFEDSAIYLRANSVLALVACSDLTRPEILRHLVDAFADEVHSVRKEAVRALEQMNGEESCLALRVKAYAGDVSPEVLGQVFDSILQLEGERGVTFVVGFLKSPSDETRDEAALALGGSRLPSAVKALIEVWDESRRGPFALVVLRALSSSRDETALDFLLTLVKQGAPGDCAAALDALQFHTDSPEIRARVEQARKERAE